jgi:hypothetical protein
VQKVGAARRVASTGLVVCGPDTFLASLPPDLESGGPRRDCKPRLSKNARAINPPAAVHHLLDTNFRDDPHGPACYATTWHSPGRQEPRGGFACGYSTSSPKESRGEKNGGPFVHDSLTRQRIFVRRCADDENLLVLTKAEGARSLSQPLAPPSHRAVDLAPADGITGPRAP